MPDKSCKWPVNVPGDFYVDEWCLDCACCRETAPDFFKRNNEGGYSFVYKQPVTPTEISQCMAALGSCPCDAIGKDGQGMDGQQKEAKSFLARLISRIRARYSRFRGLT